MGKGSGLSAFFFFFFHSNTAARGNLSSLAPAHVDISHQLNALRSLNHTKDKHSDVKRLLTASLHGCLVSWQCQEKNCNLHMAGGRSFGTSSHSLLTLKKTMRVFDGWNSASKYFSYREQNYIIVSSERVFMQFHTS